MFRGSVLGVLIDKATSHLLLESDWVTIMHICDLISQNDVEPRTVFVLIKEKLKSENPCTALYALIVLEGIIKNCGFTVCKELTTKMNCQFLYELARTTPHSKVKEKLLELIQACAFALRKNSQHGHLKELVSNLKSEGHKFPPLRESDAMFAVDCAPEWAIGDSCQRCRVQLTLINRKYNCRHCGQVFCLDCSQSKIPLPKFGIEIDVRVCDGCYAQLTMPQKPDAQKDKQEGLQLGLGFSQSEAEAKEKENIKIALHDANNAKCEMAIETMNRFTDDLLREKIFHCQICDELCTSDIFLVKGKGNVCGKCFEEKCGEEMKSRGELNTALILIISKLKLPCKFQPKGCDKRVAPKKYSKHIGRCEFKIKPCPMVNFKGCEWKGINLEVAEHIQEIHKEDVIKSDNNIFKVEASLTEPVSVKLLSDDCNNCILETLVEDNKFYYALHQAERSEENMEYSVVHRSVQATNQTVVKTVGTLTKLNGIYNEMNLDKNPNATVVDLDSLKGLADEKNMILNEFNLNPKIIDEGILKLLECPVCMNTMRTPIYQCSQGHSVCMLCHEELNECPTCKNKWSNVRNYLIEQFLTNIKFPCRFSKFGCKKIDVENRLNKHEVSCAFIVYQCPMGCPKSGNYEYISEHLNNKHTGMKYTKQTTIGFSRNTKETIKWMMFDLKLFRLSFYFFEGKMHWAVELVCSQENAKPYKYKVTYIKSCDQSSVCLNERTQPLQKISNSVKFDDNGNDDAGKFMVSIEKCN